MKKLMMIFALGAASMLMACKCNGATHQAAEDVRVVIDDTRANPSSTKIQVAILLDTSSSMDGLIEQAKSRLWTIINTLSTLKYQGRTPTIEIALYEYGNNGIQTGDYIRQVTPLTTDLDLISQQLFSLTTWGGDEYCGAVIQTAVQKLDWGMQTADMKLIYIAGNEPFNQGRISYKDAISEALRSRIYVNTIHCGSYEGGVSGMWKDGADRGQGKYFNIDQNYRVQHVDTPYDVRISECNERLNATYIAYGDSGQRRQEMQETQDINAQSISIAYSAERAVSKAAPVYSNESWDLVDRVNKDEKALAEIIVAEDLPAHLQGKSSAQVQQIIEQKSIERAAIQTEIKELAAQRQAYIDQQLQNQGGQGDDLGRAINQSVIDLALLNGYTVEGR